MKVLQENNVSIEEKNDLYKCLFLSEQGKSFSSSYDDAVGTVFAKCLFGTYVQNHYYEERYKHQASSMHGYFAHAYPGEFTILSPTILHTTFDENVSLEPRVSIDIRVIKLDDSAKLDQAKWIPWCKDSLDWFLKKVFEDNSVEIFTKSSIEYSKLQDVMNHSSDIDMQFFGSSLSNSSTVYPIMTLKEFGYPFISTDTVRSYYCKLNVVDQSICLEEKQNVILGDGDLQDEL